MSTRWQLLAKAPPWRGMVEGWIVGGAMVAVTLTTLHDAPAIAISMIFVLTVAACAGLAGLRIRLGAGSRRAAVLREGLFSLIVMLGLLLVVCGLLGLAGEITILERSHTGPAGALVLIALGSPGYLATRLVVLAWLRWDRLRRRRYVWGLTHAILVVIAGMGAIVIVVGVLINVQVQSINLAEIPPESLFGRLVMWVFTLFLVTLIMVMIGLAIFSLPAFLFAYLIARRLTSRLESLTRATQTIRTGNLGARVTVAGEDEVAILQQNFNAMAADLERSTRDLQSERDKVSGLLQIQRELTAGISHELRTPAATLIGYVDSIRRHAEGQLPEVVSHDLEIIAHEAARLQIILNDLLTLSQSEARKLSLNLQAVDLAEIARQAVETLAPLAWESKRVQVTVDFDTPLPPVRADAMRVEQILLNLIQNGIRHTPPGGVVVVTGGGDASTVWLEVADTGEGIPGVDLPHIWEKFYRAGDRERREASGFGLGLALVKELSEAMGGQVGVESAHGEGSAFRISFPTVK